MSMAKHDLDPSSETPDRPIKGRGAAANVAHRFSTETRRAVDDGWEQAAASLPQTRLPDHQHMLSRARPEIRCWPTQSLER